MEDLMHRISTIELKEERIASTLSYEIRRRMNLYNRIESAGLLVAPGIAYPGQRNLYNRIESTHVLHRFHSLSAM